MEPRLNRTNTRAQTLTMLEFHKESQAANIRTVEGRDESEATVLESTGFSSLRAFRRPNRLLQSSEGRLGAYREFDSAEDRVANMQETFRSLPKGSSRPNRLSQSYGDRAYRDLEGGEETDATLLETSGFSSLRGSRRSN